MANRCENCFNSRLLISENGYHYECCLWQKKATDCITKVKDHYIGKDRAINSLLKIASKEKCYG